MPKTVSFTAGRHRIPGSTSAAPAPLGWGGAHPCRPGGGRRDSGHPSRGALMLWVLLAVAWFLIWVISFVEILRRRDLKTAPKTAWALIVLLLPVVGLAAYL